MAVCTVRGPALAGRGSKQHGSCPFLLASAGWQPVYVCKSVVRQQTEFRCQCQATTMPVSVIAGCTNRRETDTGRKLVLQLQLTYQFERPRWQYERPECREKKTMVWKAAVNKKNNRAEHLFVQGILLTVREFCCCCWVGVFCLFVFVGFFLLFFCCWENQTYI